MRDDRWRTCRSIATASGPICFHRNDRKAVLLNQAARDRGVGFFARRFAAKEACAKALGTGVIERVGWQDIEISTDGSGAPKIALSGGALRRARRLAPKGSKITGHVSFATAKGMCIALAVIEARHPVCHQTPNR
ncbi:holo-ACP synthase [Bradyrhizobium sp. 195]|nr:holo-ACP synthase [Bradyrhizobium sp. 151]UPK30364.1 holo-ACP synthase [Bradyrhizobium sp. 195]